MATELTTKQLKFKEGVIKGLNGTEAARQAGYKGNDVTLGAVAYENLNKPHIKQAIDEHRAKIEAETEYTIKQWLVDALIARKAALTARQYSAVAASDRLLGQYLGAFELDNKQKTEQVELSEKQAIEAKRIASIRLKEA